MPIYTRLQVPSFDLNWLVLPKDDAVVLIPGGGGAGKTGVKNIVQVAKPTKSGVFEFLQSYDTGLKLCTSVTSGLVEKADSNITIVCLGFDDGSCTLLEAFKLAEESTQIQFKELTSFQADFSPEYSCVNCSQIFSNGTVATGGEDGICRFWKLSHNDEEWTVVKEADLSTQNGSVTSINIHPFKPWICIASKDGSILVVNIDTFTTIGNAISIDAGSGGSSQALKLECRGACFSNSGNNLFTLQCARRGSSSHLVKWTISSSPKEEQKDTSSQSPEKDVNGEAIVKLNIIPERVFVVSQGPSSCLCSSPIPSKGLSPGSDDESCIAVGASDGSITIVRQKNLLKVLSCSCHEFPVTGMAFSPMPLDDDGQLLLSCSADYALAVNRVTTFDISKHFVWMTVFIMMILIAYMFYINRSNL